MGSAAIPISPAAIASAVTYAAPNSAIPLSFMKPAREGLKGVPMQFAFNKNTAWLVQLQPSGGTVPLSQIAGMYVDASQSDHDVNILFPDTGYQVRVEQGSCRTVAVLTGKANNDSPNPFYVLLDSSGATTTDIVNIIALNSFIPEFATPGIVNTLSYGYSDMFTPAPVFTQSQIFSWSTNYGGATNWTGSAIIIPNKQWFITGININGVLGTSGPGTNFSGNIQLIDLGNNSTIGNYTLTSSSNTGIPNVPVDQAGLNIISAGGGNLEAVFTINTGSSNLPVGQANINISGGILVT